MILYLLAGTALASALLGAFGMGQWSDWRAAKAEAAQAKADAQVVQLQQEAQLQAANSVRDMLGAYDAGREQAKIVYRDVVKRGQDNVASGRVPAAANCVLAPDVLRELNSARAGTYLAAAPAGAANGVSGAGAVTGRDVGESVPATTQGYGPVAGVPAAPQNAGSNGQVSGGGQGRLRPKPQPIP